MAANDGDCCRWMVLFASFIGHALLGLSLDGGGAFHVLFLGAFHQGSGATAVATSLNSCIVYGIGPISGYLVNRYACWKLAFIGGLIFALGLILSAFVHSLPLLYCTFGVLAGLGMGIAYMPIITMVSQVFVEHRAIAFGIMSSGVGIGKFICPILLHVLEQTYGWRGAILMIGGICLNLCTCAMVYYQPRLQRQLLGGQGGKLPPLPESPDGDENIKDIGGSKCDVEMTGNYSERQNGEIKGTLQNGVDLMKLNLMDRIANAGSVVSLSGSMISVRADNGLKKSNLEVSFASSLQNAEYVECLKKEIAKEGSMGGIAGAFSTSSLFLNNFGCASTDHIPTSHNNMLAYCKQIGSFHSRLGISKQPSYSITFSNTELPNAYEANNLSSLPPSEMPSSLNMPADLAKCDSHKSKSILANLNIHLMANPSFSILCLNNLLFAMGYAVSNVHLPAFSMKVGLSQVEGGYFLSGIGISSIVGKILLGVLSNTNFISPMSVYISTFFAVGVATIFVPLCSTFTHFMSYALFFGFCSGSFGALLPTVVVSMTTVDLLPSAYGFLLVFEATGFLIGPSIAGGIYDLIGEYSASFYFGGVVMLLSTVVMVYPWCKKGQADGELQADVQPEADMYDLPEESADSIEKV